MTRGETYCSALQSRGTWSATLTHNALMTSEEGMAYCSQSSPKLTTCTVLCCNQQTTSLVTAGSSKATRVKRAGHSQELLLAPGSHRLLKLLLYPATVGQPYVNSKNVCMWYLYCLFQLNIQTCKSLTQLAHYYARKPNCVDRQSCTYSLELYACSVYSTSGYRTANHK